MPDFTISHNGLEEIWLQESVIPSRDMGTCRGDCLALSLSSRVIDTPCKSDRLRAAHPCALSRSTVHPEHKIDQALFRAWPIEEEY
jgi:hypothetical protein